MNYTNEMIEKAKTASSAEELMRMAADEGIVLTEEEAGRYLDFLQPSGTLLSDEELECISGGKWNDPKPKYKAGQRVVYYDPYGQEHYGTIESSFWVELQNAFYYWIQYDDGSREKSPLESSICPVKVIS